MDNLTSKAPRSDKLTTMTGYSESIVECFDGIPDVARPLIGNAERLLKKIEKMLYSAPAFIGTVRAAIPEEAYQVILTDEQKAKIADGALKLMTKKDGSLMANLIDPETKKIVSTVSLGKVKLSPELSQAMTSYATQMQMAQIAKQIQIVQVAFTLPDGSNRAKKFIFPDAFTRKFRTSPDFRTDEDIQKYIKERTCDVCGIFKHPK